MNILALETSTEYCSVALWRNGVVHARCELAGQKHSEMLMGMVDALLHEADCGLHEVDGIAFGKGPGSFTGVRIASGVAQGLALGLQREIVGVCTLLALAQASGKQRVLAVLDARMSELYLAAYELREGEWQESIAPCLCNAEHAPMLVGAGWHGVGSGFAVAGEALQTRYAGLLDSVDAGAVPQAAAVAALAVTEFAGGRALDAAQALPLYLRDKVALKTCER